jgi:PAS domain S-box-containing protein
MLLSTGIDFHRLFESAPGLYLILLPDFTIVAVSDAYLKATMTQREEILGRGLFDVFPDNPDDPGATGVSNLKASLQYVLQHKTTHTMAVQQYDIRRPDGSFEERFWSPLNKPVLNDKNDIACIIHRVEDVTEFVHLKKEEAKQQKLAEDLRGKVAEMEMETYNRAREIQQVNTRLLTEIQERKKAEETIEASQKMFSTIFYQSPVMNTIADATTGRYIEVNDHFAEFCGLKKEEIIGKTSLELNLRFWTEPRAETMDTIKTKGSARDVLTQIQAGNGDIKWVSTSAHAVNVNGRECFLTAMIDITSRKQNEALIQKQKQEIQDFIDSMSTLCAKIATDGSILIANKTAMQASGYSMEKLLATNFLEGPWWSYDPVVQDRVVNAFKTACSGVPVNYDENIFVFGQVLPINFSLMPIFKPDKSVDYILGEGRDISSLKLTEAALQKQTTELENANKELEAFSYSVSHDLRAPLRIIDGYTGIIINEYGPKLDQEGKRLLGIVVDNVRKMGQLIDDLLNLARLGRKEMIIQRIPMNKMVESIVEETISSATKQYNIEIADLDPAHCDSNLIRQVWINLISNAIKYSGDKEQPSVKISSLKTDDEIIYSIKDNGVGFNMKYADKLFGVFQRLHKMTEFEGTGVGLALVHRIVTRHGGRVWAEAEVNKGATFYFSLPVEQTGGFSLPEKQVNSHANIHEKNSIV